MGTFADHDLLDIEHVIPDLFDQDALIEPPYRLCRATGGDIRQYYLKEQAENQEPLTFFPSWTSVFDKVTPTPVGILKLIANLGWDMYTDYVRRRQHYGTFLHIQIGQFLISGKYRLADIANALRQYARDHHFWFDATPWIAEIRRDMLAFAKWCRDYNVRPLAVEVALLHDGLGKAGAIDLICLADFSVEGYFGDVYKRGGTRGDGSVYKAGDPKLSKGIETRRIEVDFKSGRKGFFQKHELQLKAYQMTWQENYPEHPVAEVYNWAPTEWESSPGYNFTNQTNKYSEDTITALCRAFDALQKETERKVIVMPDEITLREEPTLQVMSLENYLHVRHSLEKDVVEELTNTGEKTLFQELGLEGVDNE